MNDDRQLLELAAKANWSDGPTHISNDGFMDWVRDTKGKWNPLTDDGDALRLAVKLGFMGSGVGFARVLSELQKMVFPQNMDIDRPYIATRRAIVRAAAHIGKEMA